MSSTTFTVRIDAALKKRLDKLARSTGRSCSFLGAEAINEYVEANDWQIAGIRRAMESMDRGEGVAHDDVAAWVRSWGNRKPRPAPTRSKA